MNDNDLTRRITALEEELAQLKRDAAGIKDRESTRRELLTSLGLVGGAAVAALLPATPAPANTGDGLIIGSVAAASNMTALININGSAASTTGPSLSSEATMFWIDNRLSSLATANGIRGDGKGLAGSGLWGNSDSSGIGVFGSGGIGLVGSGSRAPLRLAPSGPTPTTRVDTHSSGEVVHDVSGALWFCTNDGTPGTWRQLAAPSSAGQFHFLPAPARAYDSRITGGALPTGGERTLSLRTGLASGATVDAVPDGASGALITLTLDATVGVGFLAIFADGILWPGTSNINWFTGGQVLASATVTAVSTLGRVIVHAGGSGSTEFIIDVVGYYG